MAMCLLPASLSELARLLDATLVGPERTIQGLASLEDASEADLAVFADRRYARALEATRAGAVLLSHRVPHLSSSQLIHPEPMNAFVSLMEQLAPPSDPAPGIHASAVIFPTAWLGADVRIGPHACVGAHARVGAGTVLEAGCVIGDGAVVGEACRLGPRVVIGSGSILGARVTIQAGSIIGSDGFGYRWDGRRHRRVPQLGRVRIEDDVEIGANCTLDRATLGETVIGCGSRLDNLVHVAHNVQMGPHCLLAAQVGIAGSARLGERVTLAGQVGVADHSILEEGATVVAQSGVHGRVRAGELVAGTPIMPHRVWRRVAAALPRLPELLRTNRT